MLPKKNKKEPICNLRYFLLKKTKTGQKLKQKKDC